MDRSKAELVVAAGLCVAECCGTCANWTPGRGGAWGVCEKFSYRHQKHERVHFMPAPRFGRCSGGWVSDSNEEIPKFLQLAQEVVSEEPVVDSSCEPQAAVG